MIHKALKLIRQYHRYSQKDLAQRLGISKSYLSEIESGKKTISVDLLGKYSDEFSLPVSSLVFFSEKVSGDKRITENFRAAVAEKAVRIMEWVVERETKKETKA